METITHKQCTKVGRLLTHMKGSSFAPNNSEYLHGASQVFKGCTYIYNSPAREVHVIIPIFADGGLREFVFPKTSWRTYSRGELGAHCATPAV